MEEWILSRSRLTLHTKLQRWTGLKRNSSSSQTWLFKIFSMSYKTRIWLKSYLRWHSRIFMILKLSIKGSKFSTSLRMFSRVKLLLNSLEWNSGPHSLSTSSCGGDSEGKIKTMTLTSNKEKKSRWKSWNVSDSIAARPLHYPEDSKAIQTILRWSNWWRRSSLTKWSWSRSSQGPQSKPSIQGMMKSQWILRLTYMVKPRYSLWKWHVIDYKWQERI